VTNEAVLALPRVVGAVVTRHRVTLPECLMLGAQGLRVALGTRPRPTHVLPAGAGYDLAPHR